MTAKLDPRVEIPEKPRIEVPGVDLVDNGQSQMPTTPDLAYVWKVLTSKFPEQFWRGTEAGLAQVATLMLKGNVNPATLVFTGAPGCGKSTLTGFFAAPDVSYLVDEFTPNAFVSQRADRSEAQLRRIDLLPQIKNKVFVTPEMAPTFRGKDVDVEERLRVMTRVLDGEGYWSHKGSHGGRGYRGDYFFTWIGATTPISANVWRLMGNMGSRMFFWPMPDSKLDVEALVASQLGPSYAERRTTCRQVVHSYLQNLFKLEVRGVSWDHEPDVEEVEVLVRIAGLAQLLSSLRTDAEVEFRAMTILTNFAKGVAIVHGRRRLTAYDLHRTIHLAIGSIPDQIRRGLTVLLRAGGSVRTRTMEEALACSRPTALSIMRACDGPVMEFVESKLATPNQSTTSCLYVRPEWAWILLLAEHFGPPIAAYGASNPL